MRLLRMWRLTWRTPAFLLVTLAAWLSLLVLRPLVRRRRYPTWRQIRAGVMRRWGRACLAVLGCRVTVRGRPPEPPCLLVSNHISYLDILVLAAHSPARFVSKAEIAGWPLAGTVCRTADVIFVDRGRRRDVTRVGSQIDEALRAGDPVILFPEGTSTAGDAVATLKPSLLAPAANGGQPVHWAVLRYETPADEDPAFLSVAWWGDMPLTPHAPELLKLRRVAAELEFGTEPFRNADRKELAVLLRRRMTTAFRPMVSSEEAAASIGDRRFP